VASYLKIIHSHGLVHRDLHSGNILQDDLHNAYIADLGLSMSANMKLKFKPGEIYGVLPYVAPEVLNTNLYTEASDIYSFGIIMTEIFTGYPPYYNIPHNEILAIQICLGLRPKIKCKIPKLLQDLMNRCLDAKPQNRPTANELVNIIEKYDQNLKDEQTELYKQVEEIKNLTNNSSTDYQIHEQAIYTDRLLGFQKLPEPTNAGNNIIIFSK
ncbi:kinase-like domain-containing protein, partial [Gigaspora rosea]